MNFFPMKDNDALTLRVAVLFLLCVWLIPIVAPFKGFTAAIVVQLIFLAIFIASEGKKIFVSTNNKIMVTRNILKFGVDDEGLPLFNYYLPPFGILLPFVEKPVAFLTTGRVDGFTITSESLEIADTIARFKISVVLSIDPNHPHQYVQYSVDKDSAKGDQLKLNDRDIVTLMRGRVSGFFQAIAKMCAFETLSGNQTLFADMIMSVCNNGTVPPEFDAILSTVTEGADVRRKLMSMAPGIRAVCESRGVQVDAEVEEMDLQKGSDSARARDLAYAGTLRDQRVDEIFNQLFPDKTALDGDPQKADKIQRLREEARRLAMIESGEFSDSFSIDVRGLEGLKHFHADMAGLAAGRRGGKGGKGGGK